ncbi:hypothetical protein, partial [Actinopolyspora erythraea]|uniref:hypothetical protein n=1 Tax=Actinopolyspora erythraea TaxID=414996 RepID=UPI001C0FAE94
NQDRQAERPESHTGNTPTLSAKSPQERHRSNRTDSSEETFGNRTNRYRKVALNLPFLLPDPAAHADQR